MFDPQKIQGIISDRIVEGYNLASTEAAGALDTLNNEASLFTAFADTLAKTKTADEALNQVITYNVLAFQRSTAAFARSVERAMAFSSAFKADLASAVKG